MTGFWSKGKRKEINLSVLENKLDNLLRPILPNQAFRDELKAQLVGAPTSGVLNSSSEKIRSGLLIAGGILGGAALMVAGVRTAIMILSALGIVQIKKKIDETTPMKISHMG